MMIIMIMIMQCPALESSDFPSIEAELKELRNLTRYLWISVKGANDCRTIAEQMGFIYANF